MNMGMARWESGGIKTLHFSISRSKQENKHVVLIKTLHFSISRPEQANKHVVLILLEERLV